MSKTSEKINKILADIEGTLEPFSDSKPLTTDQVVHILLGESNDTSVIKEDDGQISSNYIFDMCELQKWKEQNNNLYKIDYYRNFPPDSRKSIKIINLIKKILRKLVRFLIEPICKDQTAFNASITASLNALYNNEIVTQSFINSQTNNIHNIASLKKEVKLLSQKLNEYSQKADSDRDMIQETILKLDTYKRNADANIQELEEKLTHMFLTKEDFLNMELGKLHLEVEELQEKLHLEVGELQEKLHLEVGELQEELISKISNVTSSLHDRITNQFNDIKQSMSNESDMQHKNFEDLENLLYSTEINFLKALRQHNNYDANTAYLQKSENKVCLEDNRKTDSNTYDAIDYFDFENYFRGTQRDIKENQKIYVPYFKNNGLIIDLGSGRGEFLELLAEQNIPAIGVDLYEEFTEYCTIKGLNAVCDDGLHYLNTLKDESVGGIFAAQLVEHLKVDDIISLCTIGYQKLKPGSCLILETPNPTSLSIYVNAFYLDPSHVKPVHPKMLKYFMEKAGFQDIEIIFTESSKVNYRLPLLNGSEIDNLEEFNNGINLLSDLVFGSQDYAIIARK